MALELKLPRLVVSRVDVTRMLRELVALDEVMTQAAVRQPGTKLQLPRSSRLLEEVAKENGLSLLQEADRQKIITFLTAMKDKAPQVHMSFAVDPSSAFLDKLVMWLRTEIHPFVLLQIGLQPSIAAGCVVRTQNKFFDFSLRQHLLKSRPLLMQKIKEQN